MSDLFNTTSTNSSVKAPKRNAIWLIPLLIFLIVLGIVFTLKWESFLPRTTVEASRARLSAKTVETQGETLFQAAGWIEPSGYLTWASSLVSGTVKKVHVIDGQAVKKGDLLAELDNEELSLELKLAKARLEELQQKKEEFELEISIYNEQLKELDQKQLIAKAAAKRSKHKADTYKASGPDVIPAFYIEQAQLEYQEAQHRIEIIENEKGVIRSKVNLSKNRVKTAEAGIGIQKVNIEKLELNLKRHKIYAPTSGIINNLYAREGRKQMLGSDNIHSACVATIYNPEQIKVRVDVPLSDFSKVKIGQASVIHVETLDKPLNGVVKSIVGQADYQKNTVEVWVQIPGGHKDLRPSMLCQVEFISNKKEEPSPEDEQKDIVYIHKDCLYNNNQVWVIDLNSKLTNRTVGLGKIEQDDWIEVESGIQPGELIVRRPSPELKEGAAVNLGRIYE